jgi:hypothetical protein
MLQELIVTTTKRILRSSRWAKNLPVDDDGAYYLAVSYFVDWNSL